MHLRCGHFDKLSGQVLSSAPGTEPVEVPRNVVKKITSKTWPSRKRDSEWADQRRELEKQVEHPYITKQGLDRNRRGGKGRDSKRPKQ